MLDVSRIMDFENGDLTPNETIDLFAELVRDGTAWRLQGYYGRMAMNLIDNEFIDGDGNVLKYPEEYHE